MRYPAPSTATSPVFYAATGTDCKRYGEEAIIRASSSSAGTNAKIEINCSTGRLWELRSNNSGTFDVTDRSGSATRLTLDISGNMCLSTSSLVGASNCIIMANGLAPSGNPPGGALFTSAGALW